MMRIKLLLRRFLRQTGRPSLVETLLMAFVLSLAGWMYFIALVIDNSRIDNATLYQGYWTPSLYPATEAILWLGWVILYALPLITGFLAASFTLTEVQREHHDLLKLTRMSPVELFSGYMLGAVYRLRVPLILPLGMLYAIGVAMSYWCCDYFDLHSPYYLRVAAFDTLLGMEMAFVAWTVNGVSISAGVGAALWRKHRAQAVALTLAATIIVQLALTGLGIGGAMMYIYPYF